MDNPASAILWSRTTLRAEALAGVIRTECRSKRRFWWTAQTSTAPPGARTAQLYQFRSAQPKAHMMFGLGSRLATSSLSPHRKPGW